MARKPFSPARARQALQLLHSPAVFLNMTEDWPARRWTLEHLTRCAGEKSICFRIGKRCREQAPLFETQCSYIDATLAEFLRWTGGSSDSSVGLFTNFPLAEYWAYADYKYIAVLFQDSPAMFKDVVWSDFGCPGRDGEESTLWIGTRGSNTPCHVDSYGCNLVFQIQGRKRWHLFPPDDAAYLYPTRIPYEESSVFSRVNVVQPDLARFPAFQHARAHCVTLHPGQVLLVPGRWWHYVESIDPVTVSVNSWIEVAEDDEARVGEALSKMIVCALKTTPSSDNKDDWLNPTEEEVTSHDQNIQYLNLAVKACMEKWGGQDNPAKSGQKRDSGGHTKCPDTHPEPSNPPPFGPHLIPVTCDANLRQGHVALIPKEAPLLKHKGPCVPHSGTKPEPEAPPTKEETDGPSGAPAESGRISTNDVLDCLLHPQVVTLVTQLLMDRQRELGLI
ncbi:HSPB1-associated protein 1 homolog [Brachyhypopomus gauderio]|uniref:HSPB1-associated protein 1 homolog n=1 Tax=Brachyhypopomus gauderio TaxID=698409 RepID=UPI0040416606